MTYQVLLKMFDLSLSHPANRRVRVVQHNVIHSCNLIGVIFSTLCTVVCVYPFYYVSKSANAFSVSCRRENGSSGIIIWTFMRNPHFLCCMCHFGPSICRLAHRREGWVALEWLMYIRQPMSLPYIYSYHLQHQPCPVLSTMFDFRLSPTKP